MTEQNPEINKQTAEQEKQPIAAQAEVESAAVAIDSKPEITQEEKAANKEAKVKVEEAISRIMYENTCDYKDFHFPCKKMDVLLYRMHHKIKGRIQTVKNDEMEVDELVAAYRNRHTKSDDINFLTMSYKAMALQSESATVRPLPTPADEASASAPAGPVVTPPARPFLPELFEPIGSQAAGLVPRERAQMRRYSTARRSVRFHASVRECHEEVRDINNEEQEQ